MSSEPFDRPAVGPSNDLMRLPDLLHGQARAGPVRERRPAYVDLLPPCNAGCPAGENIQAWLAHATAGRHEQAWRRLIADNPFAAIHGRVCYHPVKPFATVPNSTPASHIRESGRSVRETVQAGTELVVGSASQVR
jgi:dihydroprymidine dehydrogenase-like protein